MVESDLHRYLKNVGTIWLYNQMCYLVDTEVELNQLGLHRYLELDNKKVIDVVGVCLKYFPWKRRRMRIMITLNWIIRSNTRLGIILPVE